MEHVETYDMVIPEFLAYPLEYGITDDMTDEDIKAYDKAVETINKLRESHGVNTHFTLEYIGEKYFSYNNDIIRQGCDVIGTKLHIFITDKEQTPMKRYTISEIRELTKETSPYFFSCDTLRFFGQTMSSFSVYHIKDRVFIAANSGYNWDGQHLTAREFIPKTNELKLIGTPENVNTKAKFKDWLKENI